MISKILICLVISLMSITGCRPRSAKKVALRKAQSPPLKTSSAVVGNFVIAQPSRDECWDVRDQDIGSFNAKIQPVQPCHNNAHNVFSIDSTLSSFNIRTQFSSNSTVKANGGPGEPLVASSGIDQDPVPTSVWTFNIIDGSNPDRIVVNIVANVEVEQDGQWFGMCADRPTDANDKIQTFICNGSLSQKFVLIRAR